MSNERLFYACEQFGIAPDGSTTFEEVRGGQSMGLNTSFSLENVFELGQISIYESIENTPDVEVTVEKVLDGYPLIYLLSTQTATSPELAGRSTEKCSLAMSYFADDNSQTGVGTTPLSQVTMSGLFVQTVTYTIPVEGNMTESVTLVGNDQRWVTDGSFTFLGAFDGADTPLAISDSGGVQRRENLLFSHAGEPSAPNNRDVNDMVVLPSGCVLPAQVQGVTSSGTHDLTDPNRARLQNITVSTDLGRTPIFELGRRLPYVRNADFPVEVTCAIEVVATSGSMVSATEDGVFGGGGACNSGFNLIDNTIKLATCEGTRINLRYKNKITSISETGGDASGGNRAVTYNFSNFNDMTVTHFNDPNTTHAANWLNWYQWDQADSM